MFMLIKIFFISVFVCYTMNLSVGQGATGGLMPHTRGPLRTILLINNYNRYLLSSSKSKRILKLQLKMYYAYKKIILIITVTYIMCIFRSVITDKHVVGLVGTSVWVQTVFKRDL